MRVFVTGGAGYVGSACQRWLVRHGHTALAYDSMLEGNAAAVPTGSLVVGDIRDRERVQVAMKEFKPDAVMHFAALASVPDSIADPDSYYAVNVIGTKNVVDVAVSLGVKRFVFSSTAATYAFDNEMPLRETSAQVPEVPYGRSKLAAEWLLRDYAKAYGIGCVMFRYFNAAGADSDGAHGECRRHEGHIIPRILQVAVGRRESLTVFGTDYATRDGTCVRDYVHTADLAQAHQLAVEQVKPGEQRAYNLGSGTGATVLEIMGACEKACGHKIRHEFGPRRPGDPETLVADPGAATRELGWKPRYSSVDQIVDSAWRWHRDHPDGYSGGDN